MWFGGLCFKHHERRGNQLHLIVFKPHWLFQLGSFQCHEIKTERLLTIVNNTIDLADDPLTSMKRAVIRYAYQAAYGKDVSYPTCSDLLLGCFLRSTELFRHFIPSQLSGSSMSRCAISVKVILDQCVRLKAACRCVSVSHTGVKPTPHTMRCEKCTLITIRAVGG